MVAAKNVEGDTPNECKKNFIAEIIDAKSKDILFVMGPKNTQIVFGHY